jgi:hypothetical protein
MRRPMSAGPSSACKWFTRAYPGVKLGSHWIGQRYDDSAVAIEKTLPPTRPGRAFGCYLRATYANPFATVSPRPLDFALYFHEFRWCPGPGCPNSRNSVA